MNARVREIFLTDNDFCPFSNIDLVFQDGVCVKSETKSHYFIATLYCLSTTVEIVTTFYHKEKKVQ